MFDVKKFFNDTYTAIIDQIAKIVLGLIFTVLCFLYYFIKEFIISFPSTSTIFLIIFYTLTIYFSYTKLKDYIVNKNSSRLKIELHKYGLKWVRTPESDLKPLCIKCNNHMQPKRGFYADPIFKCLHCNESYYPTDSLTGANLNSFQLYQEINTKNSLKS